MLYRDKRLLILATMLLGIAGFASFRSLPNSEDPELTQRFANVVTRLPGATAERVDALLSSKIEDALLSIDDIKTVSSTSSAGLSVMSVTLEDGVRRGEVDQVWTRVRSKLSDVRTELPTGASSPDLDDNLAGASTIIAAVIWEDDAPPLMGVLQRYAAELEDLLILVPNTERTSIHGGGSEEIQVTVEPNALAGLGLTVSDLAKTIEQRDSKEPAGRLRGPTNEVGIEVRGGLYTLDRLASMPIVSASEGYAVRLEDIATIEKGIADPPREMAIINGKRGIVVSARMKFGSRTELWTKTALRRLGTFEEELPDGIGFEILFQQSEYTLKRLTSLRNSLALGVLLVVGVNFLLMGWRSSLIVSLAIPSTILLAIIFMNLMGVAIHQMSVIGFIGALGMLIDNAIIMVDEIRQRGQEERSLNAAIRGSVKHLAAPLLASTLTSVLAFVPMALMPGGVGEFMRAMATTIILCLLASYILAVTWVPALMGRLQSISTGRSKDTFLYRGMSSRPFLSTYSRALAWSYQHPIITMALVAMISFAGVYQGLKSDQELFPMSDRNQFPIRLELPHTASIQATRDTVARASERILENPEVEDIYWFVGTGFPTFYYNLSGGSAASPNTAQAFVTVRDSDKIVASIRQIQETLDREFPECQAIAWQMGQGGQPDAPIEVSIKGPDLVKLSELGMELRARLSATPHVTHTRSTLKDGQAKLVLELDEAQAFRARLTNDQIAGQLAQALEGTIGGALLEDTEEVPIRVRYAADARASADKLASVELIPSSVSRGPGAGLNWVPLDSIGRLTLAPELSEIRRLDGERSTTVQGYITAGLLPSTVYRLFEDQLQVFAESLPPGYSLKIAGEVETRTDAFVNLLAYVGVIMTMMLAVLVISIRTFRGTAIIATVALLSLGFGMGALWLSGFTFGFSAVIGLVALIGVSINDSIVVLVGILRDERASKGDVAAIQSVVMRATRHVVATSVTTMAGFVPLIFSSSNIWPPMAVTIGFGVAGATVIALFFTPAAYLLFCSLRLPRLDVDDDVVAEA